MEELTLVGELSFIAGAIKDALTVLWVFFKGLSAIPGLRLFLWVPIIGFIARILLVKFRRR